MKKLLTVLLLSSSLLIVGCGENSVENVNDLQERGDKFYLPNSKEPYTGTVKSVYSDLGKGWANTEYSGSVKDGIWHGDYIRFCKNKQVEEKGEYEDGKKVGEWEYYHCNGQLSNKVTYKDGEMNGPYIEYWKNGQLYYKGSYKNGIKDGEWVQHHRNGKLEEKGTYKDGKKDGPWVRYWTNGKLVYKGTFKDGKKDGPWVKYRSPGKLAYKGTIKDGKKDGPWVEFEPQRGSAPVRRKTEVTYKNGKKYTYVSYTYYGHGTVKRKITKSKTGRIQELVFHKNGKLWVKINYNKYWKKDGPQQVVDRAGRVKTEIYKNGDKVYD